MGELSPSGSSSSIWLLGVVDEADAHALRRKIERLADHGRAEQVAVAGDGLRDRGRGDADMVERAEDHSALPRHCEEPQATKQSIPSVELDCFAMLAMTERLSHARYSRKDPSIQD